MEMVTYQQWSQGARIKWSAIIAGLAVGIAAQIVLTLLGLAIGAWSFEREVQPTQGIPLGAGIWTGISMLMSAFIGGYVTSRLSGAYLRSDGMYHGAVLWGVTWVVFAWLATTTLSFMIGGVFAAFGSGVNLLGLGVGSAVSAAASKVSSATVVPTVADLRKHIESLLQATEKPELQPAAVAKDADKVKAQAKSGQSTERVTDSAIAEIQQKLAAMDRDAAVNVMVNKLGMSEKQAQEVAQSATGMVATLKEAGTEVKDKSLDLGNATITRLGSTAWWLFLFAILSLGMSVVAGALGIGKEVMRQVEGDTYRKDVKRAVNI